MQLARIPKTSDQLGRYYTDESVAGLLVGAMQMREPEVVLDLGAGSGALIGAAHRQWDAQRYVTVDVDRSAKSCSLPETLGSAFNHYVADALGKDLELKIDVPFGTVDSALCNPPYIHPRWQPHFAEILEEANLTHILPQIKCVPADILFLAQNLRFLKAGGKLGLILPDSAVAGEKYAGLRTLLTTEHRVERVIELPRGVFKKTDAKAHIVVLTKGKKPSDTIDVHNIADNGYLSPPITVTPTDGADRLDYSYLATRVTTKTPSGNRTIRSVAKFIVRGTYSAIMRAKVSFPVFHTTDYPGNCRLVPAKFRLTKAQRQATKGVIAQQGDILVARVGRNLGQKVCLVGKGHIAVSDCVFVLRVEDEYRDEVFDYLTSSEGAAALTTSAHGVGAAFITTEALQKITFRPRGETAR